ncbi:hypothetical protein [Pseudomonas sp. 28 E 9]|uniref:hypothetical protein n=1 Tax=Pseudomonas sp. 28 E 9 TaxID=1844098 RepID=UPI0008122651|nr:hypothetical protein [Pseudomonas sp. 28 E 9]CRM05121.1 hypothetical protein [Pseudomonas sp. 28 E 9]
MRIAQGSPYDLMGEISSFLEVVEKNVSGFYYISNIDTSTLSEDSLPLDAVYTVDTPKDLITIMSAFRKDLFMSVTLPLLGSAVGALALVWAAYTHIDSKLDAVRSDASSSLDHLGDTLRVELRADRDARAKEFETIRIEMREDRKDTRDALKELMNRS